MKKYARVHGITRKNHIASQPIPAHHIIPSHHIHRHILSESVTSHPIPTHCIPYRHIPSHIAISHHIHTIPKSYSNPNPNPNPIPSKHPIPSYPSYPIPSHPFPTKYATNKVFAIYQILLGSKTCKYYYETDQLLNPRPAQLQGKYRLKVAFGPLFFPQHACFRGLGLVLYRKQTTRNVTQPSSPQTPRRILALLV